VLSTDEMVEVPTGRHTDVVLTRDTDPLEPAAAELQFYARGVGRGRSTDRSPRAPGAHVVPGRDGRRSAEGTP
jgi:hypothetical protein